MTCTANPDIGFKMVDKPRLDALAEATSELAEYLRNKDGPYLGQANVYENGALEACKLLSTIFIVASRGSVLTLRSVDRNYQHQTIECTVLVSIRTSQLASTMPSLILLLRPGVSTAIDHMPGIAAPLQKPKNVIPSPVEFERQFFFRAQRGSLSHSSEGKMQVKANLRRPLSR
jgi:hypothetical protein